MDVGAWLVTVYGVAKSQMQISNTHTHTHTHTHTMKRTSFWVLVLEGLLGLHGTVQLQLLQYSW